MINISQYQKIFIPFMGGFFSNFYFWSTQHNRVGLYKTPIGLEKEEGETRQIHKKLCNVNILFHIHIRGQIVAIYLKFVITVTARYYFLLFQLYKLYRWSNQKCQPFDRAYQIINLFFGAVVHIFLFNCTSAGGTVHNKTLNQSPRKDRNKYLW